MGVCSSADVVWVCVPPEPHPPGQAWLNGGLCIHWNGEREREKGGREAGMIEWACLEKKRRRERERERERERGWGGEMLLGWCYALWLKEERVRWVGIDTQLVSLRRKDVQTS